MHLADELSRRSAALRFEDLPPQAVHSAKVGILDTIGVTVAGSLEPAARILGRVIAPAGGASLVFGTAERTSALDAALINGTAAHALDFDDCNNTLGGHPSAPILPALFALGEVLDCTGKEFIAAYVAGFETETRIARGVHFHHYEKGWHPTATLGVFGAAAASCHLLGLDRAKTAQALAIAASLASGIKANFGTMTKPLHVGHTARSGLFAAMLALRNAHHLRVHDRVEVREGDLLAPFDEPRFHGAVDLLLCNPPYISSARVAAMPEEISKHEPRLAFDGGPFGVNLVIRLMREGFVSSKRLPRVLQAPGEMAAATNQRQGIAQVLHVPFPEGNGCVGPHDPLPIGGVQVDGRTVESEAPAEYRHDEGRARDAPTVERDRFRLGGHRRPGSTRAQSMSRMRAAVTLGMDRCRPRRLRIHLLQCSPHQAILSKTMPACYGDGRNIEATRRIRYRVADGFHS